MSNQITAVVIAGLMAVVALQVLVPAKDNSQTFAIIIGLLSMAIGQIANISKTEENQDIIRAQGEQHTLEIQKVATAVDGRVGQLQDTSGRAMVMIEKAANVADELTGLKKDLALNTELTRAIATRSDQAAVAAALAAKTETVSIMQS
jgi:hypothetical protein